jgi:hypothetical protein
MNSGSNWLKATPLCAACNAGYTFAGVATWASLPATPELVHLNAFGIGCLCLPHDAERDRNGTRRTWFLAGNGVARGIVFSAASWCTWSLLLQRATAPAPQLGATRRLWRDIRELRAPRSGCDVAAIVRSSKRNSRHNRALAACSGAWRRHDAAQRRVVAIICVTRFV